MKRLILFLFFLTAVFCAGAQHSYRDSLEQFQKKYVDTHEVVKDSSREYLKFYPIKKKYRVVADFERINDTAGFIMKTSGKLSKKYYKYGILTFRLSNQPLHLTVYQSDQLMKDDQYRDYLFVPFTDLTSGEKSYGGGRYLDFVTGDIQHNKLVLDFNKAYNPYCAYVTGYNCPVPPRENDLPVKVKAGEKDFGKKH